ncbi:Putative uncharacterized protein [Moritella viscosa]|uniref:Uncharacterized protein n=1 Tax=Moritella viscosa TaxID=80854 RepID=A0A1L0A967_9GAMM|nr:Putative uncharacterized protein [Moritella viscosa]SGY82993.1 Putative uncharacterized protein [Moritella viscosa]SGY83037.1 Putative uncharacterized protein [Moritella viscosa]SGY83401.1 Putative uncharacterized protein [Moritella viscosa]SGY83585.1 Putative uncharacterized protein [Moritella viscosa]
MTLLMFTLTSLLFVVALYIDMHLSIKAATIVKYKIDTITQLLHS